jgi:toxin ParE1/3/4
VTRYRISHAAAADIIDILTWSQERFGHEARTRYERLIATAIRDIADEPNRPGSAERPELGETVRSWHLRASRDHTSGPPVRRPRHVLIYRRDDDILVIGRILHDAMELHRHVAADRSWQ